MKQRLREYIKQDVIYQDYKKNKLMNPTDFDMFCIQHCKDIEELLEENSELIEARRRVKELIKNKIKNSTGDNSVLEMILKKLEEI